MSVQLLMQVVETKQTVSNGGGVVLACMSPRPTDPPELAAAIKSFFKWSPSGRLEFSSINEAALAELKPGQFVEVLLTPVAEGGQ